MQKQGKLKGGYQELIYNISAPAKIILCGQHAVVYGQDALAMAISLRCHFRIYKCKASQHQPPLICQVQQTQDYKQKRPFQFYQKYLDMYLKSNSYADFEKLLKQQDKEIQQYAIGFAYKFCIYVTGVELKNVNQQSMVYAALRVEQMKLNLQKNHYQIKVESLIPMGKCLGSSASINACLAASFLQLYGYQRWITSDKISQDQKLEAIFKLSLLFEKVQHGTPSGLDNYVTTYGGLIRFKGKKHNQINSVNKCTNLFPFEKLDINISDRIFQWFKVWLVDSMLLKNTKEAVEIVRKKSQKSITHQKYLEQIGGFADLIQKKLQNKQQKLKQSRQIQDFLSIISRNHYLLCQLGVSNQAIEKIIASFTIQGKMAAKITGSGMGGFVLVLVSKKAECSLILKELKQQFPRTLSASIDQKGITIQKV